MEKSRLGISIGLFAAILYFICAADNIFIVALITGYILFFETNVWLKKTAVKVLILSIFFTIIVQLITHLTLGIPYAVSIIFSKSSNYDFNLYYFLSQSLPGIINQVVYILQIIIFVIFGFKAYKQKDIKIKVIDNIINKHF
ncbi:MAG: hypothetical protein FWD71_00590 [Oscillospiraceae bacterium]|nr:hypothetical protein [Oscillospiraceae bacterium]